MNFRRLGLGATALATAGVLALAGCASGDGGGDTSSSDSGAVITANGSEPQNPLVPTNTNETGGGKILDAIFAGLQYYEADGTPQLDMAESIETEDSQTFTIKVEEGHEFTNGEPVDADSFINAWKFGALLSNEQLNSYFFEDIQGFSYDADSELTGLQKVDDYTFTVTLNEPRSDFPLRLGYSAFYPLPASAFDESGKVVDTFGENPIGNGPYMLAEEGAWQHDVQIDLVRNDDYKGERQPANGGLTIKFYATQDAAYADLQGDQVDVIDEIPPVSLPTFQDDLGDRAVNQPSAVFQSFTIGQFLPHFSGEEGVLRRQAISMAIDREQITDKIFFGTRTPAADFTTPVIAGWSDSIAGAEVLEYNPEKAKELWAEADKISPWEGEFQIAYNSDGGHQEWVDAVTNSITNTFEIEASGAPYPTLAVMREQINARTITTAARSGWQADYPGMYNFLGPLYATNAGSNDGDYSNPEFDDLLESGISNPDAEAQIEEFTQAQEILLNDLPAIPLWYQNATGGYSQNVQNVTVGWNSVPIFHQITKAAE